MSLLERKIISELFKSRSGVYQNTPENRRKHRVGQRYGVPKKQESESLVYGESSLQKFSEFLVNDVKKMINIDLKSVVEGSSRKMGGGIIVDLTKLSRNDNSSVRQYLSKKGIKTLEWDAKRTYILYKNFGVSEKRDSEKNINYDELIENVRKEARNFSSEYYEKRKKIFNKYEKNIKYFSEKAAEALKSDFEEFRKFSRNMQELIEKRNKEFEPLDEELKRKTVEFSKRIKLLEEQRKEAYQRKKTENKEKIELIPEDNFTRVRFDDVPNSSKVNLKKYLSDKVKKNADSVFDLIKNNSTEELQNRERQFIKNFNDTFESSKKSIRAFNLYLILKVKNELARRQNEENNTEEYSEFTKLTGIKRGSPMSFDEANQMRANPNFNLGGQYRVNCQCCVVNYEMRRRGFDVQAVGNPETKDSAPYKLSMDTSLSYIDPNTGGHPKFVFVFPYWENLSSGFKKSYKNYIVNFNKETKEVGRYQFSFGWKGVKWGHIVAAERFNDGSLRIYDPQCGSVLNIEDLFKRISLNGFIKVMRVDNLDIDQKFVSKIVVHK